MTPTDCRDLNRTAIHHRLATGHQVESEQQELDVEEQEEEEQQSCGAEYRIQEILL